MEKVALAAQGSTTETCARCFAQVTDRDAICPECGAPLRADASAHAEDSAVHAELAQANLYRLRGELDLAEKQCLSILKRYPNEPEAHSLLGELSADKGDFARAIEWYELALDLNPNSTTDRTRLNDLKKQMHDAETSATVEQLGLPDPPSSKTWIFAAVGIVVVLVLIGLAISRGNPSSNPQAVNGGKIVAPRATEDLTTSSNSANGEVANRSDSGNTDAATGDSPDSVAMEDRVLLQQLQKSPSGAAITGVEEDPRDKALTLTYQASNLEDARKTGALLAKDALDQSQDSLVVTVRAFSADRLIYVADVAKPKLLDLEAQNPQGIQSGSDTLAGSLLTREWTAPGLAPATPGNSAPPAANPTTSTASTSGTTSPTSVPATTTAGSSGPAAATTGADSASTTH